MMSLIHESEHVRRRHLRRSSKLRGALITLICAWMGTAIFLFFATQDYLAASGLPWKLYHSKAAMETRELLMPWLSGSYHQ
jgi:hypothetical protein